MDFSEAGDDVISLIKGFPLPAKLLELDNPWGWDAMTLKEQLFPEGIAPSGGSEEDRGVWEN